jgi:uncharacterized membrane protein YeaQ/YmgE (transglycosylase-associated protein family)
MLVFNLTIFGVFLTQTQQDSALSFASWIVLGVVVGFVGSKILNKTRHGLRRDCLLGIVGAIVGGFFSHLLGNPEGKGLDFYSLVVAIVGAAVFLIVYHALFRRRRFLSVR